MTQGHLRDLLELKHVFTVEAKGTGILNYSI